MPIVNGDLLLELLNRNPDFTDHTRSLLEAYVKGCRLDAVEFEGEVQFKDFYSKDGVKCRSIKIPPEATIKLNWPGSGKKLRVLVINKEEEKPCGSSLRLRIGRSF